MADDLSTPLGKKKPSRFNFDFLKRTYELPLGRIFFGLIGLIIVAFTARLILVQDPMGGQPIVEVPISSTRNTNALANEISNEPNSGLSIISGDNITPEIIPMTPDDTPVQEMQNPRNEFGIFPALAEQTQHGPIPRISPDGLSPFAAYARASIGPEAAAGKPLISIIVTGMGLSEGGTLDAINNLPDNITLAFAPYGRALERTANAAREGGHELMLEIPMEPFDYPNSDPGPHTLLTGQPVRENLDRLYWLMARMGGYVGTINNMGARFTSSATDLAPFMEELGSRGVGYLDDGSSNRSLTRQLAIANQVPYARASLALDENPSRTAILAQLQKLEALARDQGHAIGVISALPVSINTLVNWAAGLEENNIELVPASALMRN